MSRVICAGHVNWDVTLHVDSLPDPDGEAVIAEEQQAGGGSASNTAAGLVDLGVDVTLVGSVGDDDNGRRARCELGTAGVDCESVRTVPGAETTVKYLVVDGTGQVMVLANDGANERFEADDLDQSALVAADHLHLTGQRPSTAAALAERAAAAGVPVSIDPGRRVSDRDFTAAVSRASYLFVNEREATAAKDAGLVEAVDGVTVLTRGDGGGEVLTDEGAHTHRGYEVDAVDTTGAGDAFAAGFLAARLDGRDFPAALAVANACGALAAESVGARRPLSWNAVGQFRDGVAES